MANYPRTDTGNAELFATVSKDDLRYDHRGKRWLVWRKHWWTEDNDGLVYRRAKSVARMLRQLASQISDKKDQASASAWAIQSEARARLEAMLRLAESEYPLYDAGEGWDANPMLLGVENGVVDLKTATLRDGQQADNITLHSSIAFDPAAQCPRWLQFLSEVFGNDRPLIEYVHRAVGYSLTGDTNEQCLFLCYGSGANGKSTFLDTVRRVIGGHAFNLPFSALELTSRSSIPIDLAAVVGKRFVTAIETSESARLNEARIKMLTGCDPVTARHLYGEFFTFAPAAKLWLAFNHPPEVQDNSHGFWRRIRLIPFNQRFEGDAIDKDLLPKLLTEAPGILAWAVQGALIWQQEGLGEMPTVVRAATELYRSESDPVEEFIAECCELSPGARATAGGIWEEYQMWEKQNRLRVSLSRREFSNSLEARGFRKVRQGHQRTWIWLGIRLSNVQEYSSRDGEEVARTDADVKSP
ncbi:MAG TPA: phage/plasmid primase, P4 family, partial [Terriglobia bacterium]|nr:phage/plasmid primase, P4 family [Terriglobia bacterium]